jgi:hypothetical protein
MRSRCLLVLLATLAGAVPLAAQGVVYSVKSTYSISHLGGGDVTETISILGTDRQKTVTEGRIKVLLFGQDASGTEIIRLDRDKAYVQAKDGKFRAQDLAEVRARMEESQEKMAAEAPPTAKMEDEDVRFYVESEGIRATGERRTINGFDTRQQLFQATVMAEDKKTGEKTPVLYLTADVWVDPSHQKEARTVGAFAKEYAKHLGMEPGMMANPYARWMREMAEKVRTVEGFPIRTQFRIESDEPKDSDADETPDASSVAAERVGKAMGGLLRRIRKKPAEAEKPAESAAPEAAPGRVLLFQMTQDVTSLSGEAPPASEFEVPGE